MDFSLVDEPRLKKLERIPEKDGDGFVAEFSPPSFVRYVFRGASMKWAAYSQYGQAMTDEIFDNPYDAAIMKGIII